MPPISRVRPRARAGRASLTIIPVPGYFSTTCRLPVEGGWELAAANVQIGWGIWAEQRACARIPHVKEEAWRSPLSYRGSPPRQSPGFLRIDVTVHGDNRGWFKEQPAAGEDIALGLPDFHPVQNNIISLQRPDRGDPRDSRGAVG